MLDLKSIMKQWEDAAMNGDYETPASHVQPMKLEIERLRARVEQVAGKVIALTEANYVLRKANGENLAEIERLRTLLEECRDYLCINQEPRAREIGKKVAEAVGPGVYPD